MNGSRGSLYFRLYPHAPGGRNPAAGYPQLRTIRSFGRHFSAPNVSAIFSFVGGPQFISFNRRVRRGTPRNAPSRRLSATSAVHHFFWTSERPVNQRQKDGGQKNDVKK